MRDFCVEFGCVLMLVDMVIVMDIYVLCELLMQGVSVEFVVDVVCVSGYCGVVYCGLWLEGVLFFDDVGLDDVIIMFGVGDIY